MAVTRQEITDATDIEQIVIFNIKQHGMISAVKAYKDFTGVDLKSAKDRVDEIAQKYNVSPENKNNSGCAGVFLILVIIVVIKVFII